MIELPSFSSGKAFCTVNSVPFTLMLNSLSKCSSVMPPKGDKFANTSVGENNIDSSLCLDDLVETIKVVQFGNISLNARNIAADCLHGLVEFLLATARDEDISTFFGEQLCRGKSNSFGTAGDDCYFTLQFLIFGHRPFPLLQCLRAPLSQTLVRSLVSHRSEAPGYGGLACDHPSVDCQGCSDNVGSLVRTNEHDGIGNFFGSADTLVRNL